MVPVFMIDANDSFKRFVTCPPLPLAYPMSNTAVIWLKLRVIIVGTETTQGFTAGIATQESSGRVWETQPVRRHVGHPGDTVSRIVLYAGKNP